MSKKRGVEIRSLPDPSDWAKISRSELEDIRINYDNDISLVLVYIVQNIQDDGNCFLQIGMLRDTWGNNIEQSKADALQSQSDLIERMSSKIDALDSLTVENNQTSQIRSLLQMYLDSLKKTQWETLIQIEDAYKAFRLLKYKINNIISPEP